MRDLLDASGLHCQQQFSLWLPTLFTTSNKEFLFELILSLLLSQHLSLGLLVFIQGDDVQFRIYYMFHISAKVWPFYLIYQISPFDKFIIQPIWENSKAIFLLSFTYFLTTDRVEEKNIAICIG